MKINNFLITAQKKTSKRLLELIPTKNHKHFFSSPSFKLVPVKNKEILHLDKFNFIIFTSRFAIETFTHKLKTLKNKTLIFLSQNLKEYFFSLPITKKNISSLHSLKHSQKGIIQMIKKKNLSGSFLFPCSEKAAFSFNKYFKNEKNSIFFRYECYTPQALNIPISKQNYQAIIFLSQSAFDAFYLQTDQTEFKNKIIICFSKEIKKIIQQKFKYPLSILCSKQASLKSLAHLLNKLLP